MMSLASLQELILELRMNGTSGLSKAFQVSLEQMIHTKHHFRPTDGY